MRHFAACNFSVRGGWIVGAYVTTYDIASIRGTAYSGFFDRRENASNWLTVQQIRAFYYRRHRSPRFRKKTTAVIFVPAPLKPSMQNVCMCE
ncbi:hypothetical protein CPY51_14745 [Rhizobium tubonense]|uniref:Uncharacterized protein n=1 Tax=Rhizobium tubonense TaxID=484088 RepID=A0A2W4CNY2_9HYPH|nr:hypothetical protein CPY51_14745 [Rhizobium tubonense]